MHGMFEAISSAFSDWSQSPCNGHPTRNPNSREILILMPGSSPGLYILKLAEWAGES